MSGERRDTLVEDLERDLRDALMLEPSPDFARQVRGRIAERSTRRSSVFQWRLAVASGMVCVATVGVTWMKIRDASEPRVAPAPAVVGVDVALPPERSSPRPELERAVGSPERHRPRATARIEPEIIVPPDQAVGLTRLLELTRTRALDADMLSPATETANVALDIEPLIVPPISVSEIARPNGAPEGGAERE